MALSFIKTRAGVQEKPPGCEVADMKRREFLKKVG